MNIREQALGAPKDLSAVLASAIKAAQAVESALESLILNLMIAATMLDNSQEDEGDYGVSACRHDNKIEITTMGMSEPKFICADCGDSAD